MLEKYFTTHVDKDDEDGNDGDGGNGNITNETCLECYWWDFPDNWHVLDYVKQIKVDMDGTDSQNTEWIIAIPLTDEMNIHYSGYLQVPSLDEMVESMKRKTKSNVC